MIQYLAPIAFLGLAIGVQSQVGSDPVIHVLVQIPALAAAGYTLPVTARMPQIAVAPALILALVTGIIWMLPRSIDAALIDPFWSIAKFITLPLFLGLPLALAWGQMGPILKGFLKAQSISMLLFLAFLYTHSPVRLCNSYLEEDQIRLGLGFAYVALGLIVVWIAPVFVGTSETHEKDGKHGFS